MTDGRKFWISAASVLVLVTLLLVTDWSGGAWARVLGLLLLVATLGNLWAAISAWRRMRR